MFLFKKKKNNISALRYSVSFRRTWLSEEPHSIIICPEERVVCVGSKPEKLHVGYYKRNEECIANSSHDCVAYRQQVNKQGFASTREGCKVCFRAQLRVCGTERGREGRLVSQVLMCWIPERACESGHLSVLTWYRVTKAWRVIWEEIDPEEVTKIRVSSFGPSTCCSNEGETQALWTSGTTWLTWVIIPHAPGDPEDAGDVPCGA